MSFGCIRKQIRKIESLSFGCIRKQIRKIDARGVCVFMYTRFLPSGAKVAGFHFVWNYVISDL